MLIHFGKHKGTAVKDLPGPYVFGLLENVKDLDELLKQALKIRLKECNKTRRGNQHAANCLFGSVFAIENPNWDGDPYDDPYWYEGIPNT